MTNVNKKFNRLQLLINSVLTSVHTACNVDLDEDVSTISKEVEIMHNGEAIGVVTFNVHHAVLSGSSFGSWNDAPHGFESDLILESAEVDMIYNTKGDALPNVTAAVNQLLSKEEGQILNYA